MYLPLWVNAIIIHSPKKISQNFVLENPQFKFLLMYEHFSPTFDLLFELLPPVFTLAARKFRFKFYVPSRYCSQPVVSDTISSPLHYLALVLTELFLMVLLCLGLLLLAT